MREARSDNLPDLLRGNTEALLLFLVNELGLTYGYQLIREAGRRSQGFFHFKEGTVYPALRKLENDGLLHGEWQEVATGQERRYYRITDKGQRSLEQKMAMWQHFSQAMELVFKPSRS